MGRTVAKEIPWPDGPIIVHVRVWSARERDMHDRKFLLGGEALVAGVIAALADPKVNAAKSTQIIRTLVEDQRKRAGEIGGEGAFDKLATVLVSVGGPVVLVDGLEPDVKRRWLDDLDADVFDAILRAADQVLYLSAEEKKTSGSPGPGSP